MSDAWYVHFFPKTVSDMYSNNNNNNITATDCCTYIHSIIIVCIIRVQIHL